MEELRGDLDKAYSLIPGKHRLNLHACYADLGGKNVERNAYTTAQFQSWIDWCKERGLGLDFNPTFFAHPLAESGLTLTSPDKGVRQYWIEHAIACRHIGADIGKQLANPCVNNLWIADGYKGHSRRPQRPRANVLKACWTPFSRIPSIPKHNLDAVESKLFVHRVGSLRGRLVRVLHGLRDQEPETPLPGRGPFPPDRDVGGQDQQRAAIRAGTILLHVSRGVRWDSDHVVLLDDATRATMEELVRGDFLTSHSHRPGLFRRQHQPHRRLGDRHAQRREGSACWRCWNRRTRCARQRKPATSPRASR